MFLFCIVSYIIIKITVPDSVNPATSVDLMSLLMPLFVCALSLLFLLFGINSFIKNTKIIATSTALTKINQINKIDRINFAT